MNAWSRHTGVGVLDTRRQTEVNEADVDALSWSSVDHPWCGGWSTAGLCRHDARQQSVVSVGSRRHWVTARSATRRQHCQLRHTTVHKIITIVFVSTVLFLRWNLKFWRSFSTRVARFIYNLPIVRFPLFVYNSRNFIHKVSYLVTRKPVLTCECFNRAWHVINQLKIFEI